MDPLPSSITDRYLVDLYAAQALHELAKASFAILEELIEVEIFTFMPLPDQFEHPIMLSKQRADFRAVADEYVASAGHEDIWALNPNTFHYSSH